MAKLGLFAVVVGFVGCSVSNPLYHPGADMVITADQGSGTDLLSSNPADLSASDLSLSAPDMTNGGTPDHGLHHDFAFGAPDFGSAPVDMAGRVCTGSGGACGNAVVCGSSCCGSGEWCDNGTCRCGNVAACSAMEHCASGPVGKNDSCGSLCCGGGNPCPL